MTLEPQTVIRVKKSNFNTFKNVSGSNLLDPIFHVLRLSFLFFLPYFLLSHLITFTNSEPSFTFFINIFHFFKSLWAMRNRERCDEEEIIWESIIYWNKEDATFKERGEGMEVNDAIERERVCKTDDLGHPQISLNFLRSSNIVWLHYWYVVPVLQVPFYGDDRTKKDD